MLNPELKELLVMLYPELKALLVMLYPELKTLLQNKLLHKTLSLNKFTTHQPTPSNQDNLTKSLELMKNLCKKAFTSQD